MSWQLRTLNVYLRTTEKTLLSRLSDPAAARARLENQSLLFPMPSKASFREVKLASGGRALRLPAPRGGHTLLWFHGGAYIIGSPRTHGAMAAALAHRAKMGVVMPWYRLAPEHPFPAAINDCIQAWENLMAEGLAPDRIILGGDSAGGGLAFALLHKLLSEHRAPPCGVVAFGPWVDLGLTGDTLFRLSNRDVLLPIERIPEIRDTYLQGANPRAPLASPLYGDFEGAPPILIQASDSEVLLDDARRLARRFSEHGTEPALAIEPGLPHVWQLFQGWLPEADASLDQAAAWMRAITESKRARAAQGT
ncbi:MAG: alpha/beta hydrolase [Pseudomonadota bacterium]